MANTKDNARRRATRKRIVHEFICLLENREVAQISVTELCRQAGINRATFYANFDDIYDLATSLKRGLENRTESLYDGETLCPSSAQGNYLPLLEQIREHQQLYRTYFKLCRDEEPPRLQFEQTEAENLAANEVERYHRSFRAAGITAVIKMWLAGSCAEEPEQIAGILAQYIG